MNKPDDLDRINALTRTARSTWFALLAALVFIGFTLMGVEDIDFYGVDRFTTLPLVSVEVPTRFFFVAAPIFAAALHCYFHFYLIRLWDALGSAQPRQTDVHLGDAVTPWLVNDAALFLRATVKQDGAIKPRHLDGISSILNLLLIFFFTPAILAATVLYSLPARDFTTILAAMCFLMSLYVSVVSLRDVWTELTAKAPAEAVWVCLLAIIFVAFICARILLQPTPEKVQNFAENQLKLRLWGLEIVDRPPNWTSYRIARRTFRDTFCKIEEIEPAGDCNNLTRTERNAFFSDFKRLRRGAIRNIRRPDWDKSFPASGLINFWKADFTNSFLPGVNLREAKLKHVSFKNAYMEAINLNHTTMQNVDLTRAEMHLAEMIGADMTGIMLKNANMEAAVLDFSLIAGTRNKIVDFGGANLRRSHNGGGALRHVDLTQVTNHFQADFRNSFLDGSVAMSAKFRQQMGFPCQWVEKEIAEDAEYYGRWRGWIEAKPNRREFETWATLAPPAFKDVDAIAPSKDCAWKTDQMSSPNNN